MDARVRLWTLLLLLPVAAREARDDRQLQQVLALAGGVGAAGSDGVGGEGVTGQSRIGHRIKLLFPLLLSIASRLGTLVPVSIAILTGVASMAMFANAAFTVSLASLALLLWDKLARQTRPHGAVSYFVTHAPQHIGLPWGQYETPPKSHENVHVKRKSRGKKVS